MFVRSSKWHVKSIILIALIGIIMGVVYAYGFNSAYNAVRLLLTPTGFAPAVDTIFSGLWYMAAPLAIYFVPAIGSGTIGELLASIVEAAMGGQWGAATLISGICQGLPNEIGFFPKKERYQRFSWTSVLIGSVGAHFGGFFSSYFMYGWGQYKLSLQLVMFFTGLVSSLLFDGVLIKLVTELFEKSLKPRVED